MERLCRSYVKDGQPVTTEDAKTERLIRNAQKAEITEYHIYKRLAASCKHADNSKILSEIADSELQHYRFWKAHTGREVQPDRLKVWFYSTVARLFGLSFGLRLMEAGEDLAQDTYAYLAQEIPELGRIEKEEGEHEQKLIEMIDEERLQYVSSIVLGLNDALVELTGALAGLTLALQDARLVALTGLVTGIAAALSMGASEYLATKTEQGPKEPFRASLYTGGAYIIAVAILIIPFMLLSDIFLALGWTLANAILIILIFTYYISVAKALSFRRRFGEMAAISLGVAVISFFIGWLVRHLLGAEV
jgi:VIT1/CCC1 family predicted Fe2+/Mn2+ transporter